MKNLGRVFLVGALFCSGLTFAQERGTTNVVKKSELIRKEYVPSKDMVSLNPIEKEFNVKRGQQCYYSGSVHGSVGNTVKVWSEGEGLKLVNTHFNYDDPKKSNMSGGDGGTKYFVFDALKKGTYTVVVEESYRGEVQHTYRIKVIVD
jgi:hypothetical protein